MPTPPIPPSSVIEMFTDVPINGSYEHTFYFGSVPEQTKFFDQFLFRKIYYTTYNRQNQEIMINEKADDYYSCNYLRFQNPRFGTKYFYGFITDVLYVNENTTKILWEMDYIQSYWFEFTFPQQYVERCHGVTDEIGDNIVDESVAVGEMVNTGYQPAGYGDTRVVIAVGDTRLDDFRGGYVYNYMYSGLQLYQYSHHSHEIKELIKEYGTRSSAIAMMYTCPVKLLPSTEGSIGSSFQRDGEVLQFPKPIFGQSIDGYIPRNAKLYTYPFYFFHVSNNNGGGLPLRYEFFEGDFAKVYIQGSYVNPVQIKLRPGGNYKRNNSGYVPDEYLMLADYPQISWVSDYYQQWIAQNGVNTALSTIGNILNVGASVVTGNPAGAISGVAGVINSLSSAYVASNHADIIRGGNNSGNANMVRGENDFFFTTYTLNKQMARTIDSFFTRYGYAQKRLMNLVFWARPSFTYIKTYNAHVNGTASDKAKKCIQDALNRGITFWRGNFVGDYTRDNSVSHAPHPDYYTLLVNDGFGAGEYLAGTTVTIKANNPPEGMIFDHWEITTGIIPNPTSPTTTFTMPEANTQASAFFREKPKPEPEPWNLAKQLQLHLGEVEWSSWITDAQVWMFGSFTTAPWCATCVAYCAYELNCLDQFGVPALGSKRELASTTSMKNRFATLGKLHPGWGYDKSYTPKQGDVLFISWSSNPSDLDHTALCWGFSVEGVPQLTYIGGNQGTGDKDGITMRTVPPDSKIICWVGEINNDGIVKP